MRPTLYKSFTDQLNAVIASKGKIGLPNVKKIHNPADALTQIKYCNKVVTEKPYYFLVLELDTPFVTLLDEVVDQQVRQVEYYPWIFLHSAGMGGEFDGTGVILTAAGAYSFAICEHEWDESGANRHIRGWHPKRCTKCGFDASIDSGD